MREKNIPKSPLITLSMIVKNEESYLSACLESVKGIIDEIIIVDTGSTDSTISIAEKFGAKIYHFDWVNDFSTARNYSLQKCTGEWILYLDADERLSQNSVQEIRQITKQKDKLGVFCTVKSSNSISGNPSIMKYPRLFRNVEGIKFVGKVHEQIESSLIKHGFKIIDSSLEIIHVGYDIGENQIRQKAERNMKLLSVEYDENKSGYNAFQLGQTLNILDRFDEANNYFKLASEDAALEIHHRAQAFRQLAAFELKNKNYSTALTLVEKGLLLVEESPLLNIVKANILLETGQDSEACSYCKRAYRNNFRFLKGEIKSNFEITINENNILMYGINLAIAATDSELFAFFFGKLVDLSIPEQDSKIILFYKKILNNESIEKGEILEILNPPTKIDFNILIKNISKYKNIKSKIDIIRIAHRNNFKNDLIRNEIVSLLISNDSNTSIEYFELGYELEPNNLEIGFQLLNAYLASNKLEDVLSFIEKALISYSSFPAIVEKFKNIQATILKITK